MHLNKGLLRSQAKAERRSFYCSLKADDIRKINKLIANKILSSFNFSARSIIAGYWPITEEASIIELLAILYNMNYQIALPIVSPYSNILLFREWSPYSQLKAGIFKTLEPCGTQPFLEPDVLFVPLLRFDHHGHRLGYGGGYYDKTITYLKQKKDVITIGIAYEKQIIDTLPVEPHDQALQWVVTEYNAYHFY